MQESARRSSGVYDTDFQDAPLTAHAADPAGFRRATDAGIPVGLNAPTADDGASAPPQPQQPAPVPWYKTRKFIISQIIIAVLGIALLFILLFPVVTAIAQLVVNRSTLDIQTAVISNPSNGSFDLAMTGNVAHTGIINAQIWFTEPISVSWVLDNGTSIPIGTMPPFDKLSAKNHRANINQTTTLNITDQAAFGEFAKVMITSDKFTWHLSSRNLRVQAVRFPVSRGIRFDKDVVFTAFNSFSGNVLLQDFQLPSDNPNGGINFVAKTQLANPSPFALNLGTVVFALSYDGVNLGLGTGTDTVIAPGNNTITLKGVLNRINNTADLAKVSTLFTRFLNSEVSPVIATGVSTLQNDGTVISWLSDGLTALRLEVPFKPFTPIDPIREIDIGSFNLAFTEQDPWAPSVESDSVVAKMQLPFGFNVAIAQIQNDFNISKDGLVVAGLQTPIGASTSSIRVLGETDTEGTINITIKDTQLSVPTDAEHAAFSTFNANLTSQGRVYFQLAGNSVARANMSIGEIELNPIKVNVTTYLDGLNGLSNGLTTIQDVDVTGGQTGGIELGINVMIQNPSNLKLSTGDLNTQLYRDGVLLGTATMPNLTLIIGNNSVKATSLFAANDSPQGQQTLNDFVGKKDVQLKIRGYDGSTKITSLAEAFKTLDIDVVLPGLKTNLLDTAALKVLNSTGTSNNISHVTVLMDNPFSTPLEITRIQSTVSTSSILLGSIDTATSFKTQAKSKTTSPNLDLNMNLDPASLFTVTRILAVDAGLDVEPLDGIVELGGYQYLKTTGPSPKKRKRANLYTGFDLPTFVNKAFKQLKSDVSLSADVTIGEYNTVLQYIQDSVPTETDESLDLLLPILARPIVQTIVTGSGLGIDTVVIQDPKQNSFGTRLKGSITNAGPFDAEISFGSGLTVSWSGKPLGNMKMDAVKVTGDVGATLDLDSTFEVADVDHLTDFTKTMVTQESFDWEITGDDVTVNALGISVPGITLTTKRVTLKGMNNLNGGVKINTFDLPSNDPAGGIHLTLDTTASNPSQVGVALSSISFETYAGGILVAPVHSDGSFTLAPQSSSKLALAGRLIPQDSDAGLAAVSAMFNNFIHGKDSDLDVRGAGAGPSDVTWLNEGIKALRVATALPNQGPLDIIKSISLNQLQLMFTQSTAYNPSTSSQSTDAAFTLPFAFPVDITALSQTITTSFNGQSFAELVLPKSPSRTDVGKRIIHLTFSDIPFAVFGNQHGTFNDFVAQTTTGKTQTLGLSGTSNADASTAVGVLSLSDIAFNVQSSIDGLQGLNVRPTTVSDLDVAHGYPDYLLITTNSHIFNPSNLTIGTNDVSFSLQYQGKTIGSANLDNLVIVPGNASYATGVHFSPQGDAQDAGRALLQNYLQGIDADTVIAGSTSSTPIDSLKSALSQIRLSPVTIPALHQNLIKSASLTFPTNIVKTGIAQTSFTLDNPFTASINLLTIGATATYQGLRLGVIDHIDASSHPIHADGHGSVTSPALPMKYNLDPVTIIKFLSLRAQVNHVNMGPLVDMFQFVLTHPDYHPPITTSVDTNKPTCVSGKQFDVNGAILATLKGLEVDLAVDSGVKLDDYPTSLAFDQKSVPAVTDETALYLIGAVAAPIAQSLVDGSVLKFSEAIITNITDDGFDLFLKGSLTNVGPLDALITFVEPLDVTWNGQAIATITLPPVCAAANSGVPDYETTAHVTITRHDPFTDFAIFLLHNPSFDWTISTSKLRLTALGTIFDGVSLSKTVSFKAFNNLPGVTISNFQLPSDDSAGGIHIETDAQIPSPAQIGIDLGTVGFKSYFQDTFVGPLTGSHLTLAPSAVTSTHLSGRIVPQSGDDLDTIGVLFSNFLQGKNQTLVTKGDSVQPDGSSAPVTWLSTAFKTLELEVVLPGEKFDVIQSIALSDLEVTLDSADQAYAPPTSSKHTLAKYKNPFGFSLQVIRSAQDIIMSSGGIDIAKLELPSTPADGGVSTGNVVDLVISWEDQPLTSLNNAAYNAMFAAVTNTQELDIDLKGSADVVGRTTIGDVPISGIPIDVPSSLEGINAFGHTAKLSNISVTGSGGEGGNEYIVSPATTGLDNPSNITLHTVDTALPVLYQGTKIGRAAIDDFDLLPGSNDIATEFHYNPDNANDTVAQDFLTLFITTDSTLPLAIKGDSDSTPIPSLKQALALLQLGTSVAGLNHPTFITHIHVTITLESLVTNLVSVDFDLFNPLDAPLTIEFVQSDAGVNGEVYSIFSQPFSGFTVNPGETKNSGVFGNVLLVKGALLSLDIIPLGYLDVKTRNTLRVGDNGYQIPWMALNQDHVPTNYDLSLGFAEMQSKAKAISESSESPSSTAATATTKASSSSIDLPTVTSTDSSNENTSSSTSETTASIEEAASKIVSSVISPSETIN